MARAEVDQTLAAGDIVVLVGRIHYRGKGSGAESATPAGWMLKFRDNKVLCFRAFREPQRGPRSRGAVGVDDAAGERGGRAAGSTDDCGRGVHDLGPVPELLLPGPDGLGPRAIGMPLFRTPGARSTGATLGPASSMARPDLSASATFDGEADRAASRRPTAETGAAVVLTGPGRRAAGRVLRARPRVARGRHWSPAPSGPASGSRPCRTDGAPRRRSRAGSAARPPG